MIITITLPAVISSYGIDLKHQECNSTETIKEGEIKIKSMLQNTERTWGVYYTNT